jgi:hypothetical protein
MVLGNTSDVTPLISRQNRVVIVSSVVVSVRLGVVRLG